MESLEELAMRMLERLGLWRTCAILAVAGALMALQRQFNAMLADNLAATLLVLIVAIMVLTWIGPMLLPGSDARSSSRE